MEYPSAADRRDRIVDILSRLLGVAVFGSLGGVLGFGLWGRIEGALAGTPTPLALADLVSKSADLLFLALLVTLFVVRHRPVRKKGGAAPRIAALLAALGLPYVVLLPRFDDPTVAWIAAGLGIAGNVLALVTLAFLGRSFSIFPEARRLVTSGPYAIVRHPLYLAEEIAIVGMILNHLHWIAVAAGAVHLGIQILRMGWEEKVLGTAFPEYAAYRARTWRFLPGIW